MSAIPAQFDGIDHVVLRVADIDRTLNFYVGVLGLTLERVLEYMGLHQLRCGRNLIDILPLKPGERMAEPKERGVDHLCLNVRGDIDEIVAALERHGVPIVMLPTELYGASGYSTSIYITDPDGHVIELKANYAKKPVRFAKPVTTVNLPSAKKPEMAK